MPPVETKELKKRVRNIIDPARDLGHVDGHRTSSTLSKNPASSNNVWGISPASVFSVQNELPSKTSLQADVLKAGPPIPEAMDRLHGNEFSENGHGEAERKLTPVGLLLSLSVVLGPGRCHEGMDTKTSLALRRPSPKWFPSLFEQPRMTLQPRWSLVLPFPPSE
jgi:hypothetical protein